MDLEADDAVAEVERLLALGARRTDVGQTGREGFEVLVDPEGDEFCILTLIPLGSRAGPAARPLRRPLR